MRLKEGKKEFARKEEDSTARQRSFFSSGLDKKVSKLATLEEGERKGHGFSSSSSSSFCGSKSDKPDPRKKGEQASSLTFSSVNSFLLPSLPVSVLCFVLTRENDSRGLLSSPLLFFTIYFILVCSRNEGQRGRVISKEEEEEEKENPFHSAAVFISPLLPCWPRSTFPSILGDFEVFSP